VACRRHHTAAAANPVIVSHRRPDVSFAPLDIAMLVAIE
jgi:hypothetical protein